MAALAWPALVFAADPQIASLVDDPDPVPAGGLFSYVLGIDNNAVDAALNTRVRLQVPAGATFVSATPASANCVPTSATQVDCNLGTLGASGTDARSITLTWRAIGPGPTTVAANATLTADNDSNNGNNTQNAVTTVVSGANLALAKTGTPNPVVGGADISYTLTPSNAGPNASGDLVVTDNLSPSTSFVSAAGSGWTCAHSAGVVTCTRPGPHPVAAAIPAIVLVARVNASGGAVTNSATVAPAASGGTPDPDNSNNTATVDTTVLPGADVRIAQKTVSSGLPAVAGSNVSFQIQPRNGGPASATDAVVTDTLPAGWTFVSASGPNWACSALAQTVNCSRAVFPAGATDNITIVAAAPPNAVVGPTGTTYTNTASITASSSDPNAGNNSGSVDVPVLPDGADLRLAKSKTPNPVAQGSNMTSTITVTNNGPRPATGPLRVVEVLSGETFVSAAGGGWSCSAAGAVITCTHPNGGGLAVDASLPALTLVTTATSSGAVANTACTGGSVPAGAGGAVASPPLEGDPNPGNDCATVSVSSTTVQPDLAITKTTSTPSGGDKIVSTGESSVTYTLVITNASLSAQAATGVRITDTVPGFIAGSSTINTPVLATASGGSSATFNCVVLGAGVACAQTGGVLAQGQTVTVPITVNRPLQDGSFTNTATVSNSTEGDPNPANNTASDTVTISPIADVQMTGKSVTPAAVRAGENATYVLSYRNNGPSTASGVVVSDTFAFPGGDAGLTVVSIASTKGGSTCNIGAGAVLAPGADSFSCTMGLLANGETQSITLVVRPNFQPGNAARTLPNTARVTTTSVENPGGGDNGNNELAASLGITPAAIDLLVNKTDVVDPVPFTAGATFMNYRVRVTSNGPSFGTNVRITEVMTPPAGKRVRFVCDTTTLGGSTCRPVTQCSATNITSAPGVALPAFTCSVPVGTATTGLGIGELASGQSKDIFLRFEAVDQPAPTGDIFNNVATVSANEPDTTASNDSESEPTTTRQRIDLRVSKAASNPSPTLMQPFNWVVTVVNNGPGNSLQTDLTDTLPAGVQVTGAITWTRTLQPASGSCAQSGQTVSCALGQLDGAGSATITIPVRVTSFPSGGTLANSATVDTDPVKTGGIDTPGGNNTGSSTVTVTRSSLAGTVFEDRDRSGANGGVPQAAASEPRVAGVALQLTGTDAYGNSVNLSATTDGNGNYSFPNLAPSNASGYTVTEVQPAGFVNGPVAPPVPAAGGSYNSGGAAGASSYTGVVLGAAAAATDYNFPEVRRPGLSGFVYVDSNLNGSRDAGTDTAIAGATVRLLDANTLAVVAVATTSASGAYNFANLDPLTPYVLEEPLPAAPAGLINGPVNPGLIGGVACVAGCTAQADTPAAGTDRIAAIDLGSGADGSLFNFGERQTTSISGLVFVDSNRNGTLDGSEATRLAGVGVRLVQGADCSSGTTLQSTTTAADGSYGFAGVLAGQNYLVCETQPAGYGSSTTNQISITNLPVAGSANNRFGETLSTLSGAVYLDANNDGTRQPADSGIAGVTVTLTGTDATGAPVSRSTLSDATGAWRFDDLLAGNYSVTEQAAQPLVGAVSTLNGRTGAGSSGGAATAVAGLPSAVSAIALAAGVDAIGYLFGEILPVAIAGTVFIDVNNNGVQNLPADSGLPGVTLVITGTDDTGAPVTRSVVTAADGSYSVPDLRPGTYTVTEPVQPAGTSNGQTVAGSAGGSATPVLTQPSAVSGIVLTTPGAASAGNNFAEIPNSSAINGRVWLDANNNGAIDGSEAGIAGVVIELTGTDTAGQPVSRSTATDAAGNYSFGALSPGNYTLREPAQPAGTVNGRTIAGSGGGSGTPVATAPSSIAGIALAVGQTASANLFGEVPAGEIAGSVWADNNNNGIVDPGEAGLPGVTLVLSGTDDLGNTVSITLTTAADGSYSFGNLRPGSYTLTEPTQPPGTVNGATVPGTLGGTATPPATAPSVIGAITLPPGGRALQNNFGELALSPDLRVSKAHTTARFTVGKTDSYTLTVRNIGEIASSGAYSVSDRLPSGLTLAATPTGAGWACAGAAGASSFTCTTSTVVAAGATQPDVITAVVAVGAAAAAASPVNNVALVDGGGEIDARRPSASERDLFDNNPAGLPVCTPAIEHNACHDPTTVQLAAAISGTVWHDTGSVSRLLDGGDRRLPGWGVEVVDTASGTVLASTTTAADGSYRVGGLVPGVPLAVRFRDPASGVVFGYPVNGDAAPGASGATCVAGLPPIGTPSSCVGSGASPQLAVVLAPGQELPQQSLPVDPSGVVYDSGLRSAVPGAVVTLAPVGTCSGWNPAAQIVGAALGGYAVSGNAIAMTVGNDGFYQFLLAPTAPASCSFTLAVTPPSGYTFTSTAIPPTPGPLLPGGGAGSVFAVQPQAGAPTAPVGSGTTYYLLLTTGSAGANIVHNHIPLDPALPSGLSLSKTGDRAQAEIGDSVRYAITVQVTSGALPRQTTVVDRLPAGFTYIRGTATANDQPIADPQGGVGPTLAFQLGAMPASGQVVLRYRVRVAPGAMQGDGINRAQAQACGVPAGCVGPDFKPLAGAVASNESRFRVRVSGGVFGNDACVAGKIFVDCNNNHVQDAEELGIPGVRLVLQDGTTLVSDSEGKYSLCGLTPNSHVLKVDPVTLPIGSRLTTSSNRNLGDAGSLWLDLKNGELHRADFVEGSCTNRVLEQVKARRAQGEVRAPESEKGPALRFESKPLRTPQQGTDGAKQPVPKPRDSDSQGGVNAPR